MPYQNRRFRGLGITLLPPGSLGPGMELISTTPGSGGAMIFRPPAPVSTPGGPPIYTPPAVVELVPPTSPTVVTPGAPPSIPETDILPTTASIAPAPGAASGAAPPDLSASSDGGAAPAEDNTLLYAGLAVGALLLLMRK